MMKSEEAIKKELSLYKKMNDNSKSRWRYGYIDGLEFALKCLGEDYEEHRGK